jgi:hypothetical protein
METFMECNLDVLTSTELEMTIGGGFFYDLGVWAHTSWNDFNAYMNAHPNMYKQYSRQGI